MREKSKPFFCSKNYNSLLTTCIIKTKGNKIEQTEHIVGVRNSAVMSVVSPYRIWRPKKTNEMIRDKTHF